jgi:hypothetical protein
MTTLGSTLLLVCSAGMLVWGVRGWLALTPVLGRAGRLAVRVWVPLLIIVPACAALLSGGLTSLNATATGLLLLGPMLGGLATLLVLLPSAAGLGGDPWDAEHRLNLFWPATGVLLLLAATAGRLAQSALLVCFALGVVLPWAESIPRRGEGWGGPGMGYLTAACVGAAGLGTAIGLSPDPLWLLLGPLVVGIVLLWFVRRRMGPHATIECGMWIATIGGLLGPGMLGWETMVANFKGIGVALTAAGEPHVGGLGILSVSGLALLLPCGVLAGMSRWPSGGRLGAVLASTAVLLSLTIFAWG